MFRSTKRKESHIEVDLDEPLTGFGCTKLVMEILKYIMYQKQQIPLSCDTLMKLHANSKPTDRNFSSMQGLIDSLCSVSDQLASQFINEDCDVKEIVIIIGATIVSPKVCVRFQLPENLLSSNTHLDYQHSFRKPLLSIMRSFLECIEFQEEMTVPLGPTNTFVLVHKKDPHQVSEFFLPKPQFSLNQQNTSLFNVKLSYNRNQEETCSCKDSIRVHRDSFGEDYGSKECCTKNSVGRTAEVSYQWYQSKNVFKGFKFLR